MNSVPSPNAGFFSLGLIFLLASGCPTWRTEHKVETTHKIEAHIVLDIRKIQDEAAKVESEVRATPTAEASKPQSMLLAPFSAPARSDLWKLIDWTPSAAAAKDGDPIAQERGAIERRKQRFSKIDQWLSSGCLGENNKGFLDPRDCEAGQEAAKQAELKHLMTDENADRKIIYAAIAAREGAQPDNSITVGSVYSGAIREKLKKGQWFQIPSHNTLFEDFRKSSLGAKFADAKKGDWVRMK